MYNEHDPRVKISFIKTRFYKIQTCPLFQTYLHKIVTLIGQLHGASRVDGGIYFDHILCRDLLTDKEPKLAHPQTHRAFEKIHTFPN